MQLAYSPWKRETEAIAYRNPDGTKVVVLTNWAKDERKVSFVINGNTYALALKPRSFNTFVAESAWSGHPARIDHRL